MNEYTVNTGISFEHPDKGFLYHLPGEVADLTGWPDIPKMIGEGTITPVTQSVSGPVEESARATEQFDASSEESS